MCDYFYSIIHTYTCSNIGMNSLHFGFFYGSYLVRTVGFLLECISVKKRKCPVQQQTITTLVVILMISFILILL